MTNPRLPPLLVNKASSVFYVYTYKNVWDRDLKRSKRGGSKNRKGSWRTKGWRNLF